MVSSNFKPCLISSILVLMFLSFVPSSCSVEFVKVKDICFKTRNPPFCLGVLKSKEGANLLSLGQYTIEIARANASNTLNLIQSLINQTSDPQLKDHYSSCSKHYNETLVVLQTADQYLSFRGYNAVKVCASTVLTNVDDCDSQPPTDPSSLPKNNKDLGDISVIITVIANFLAQN